MSQNPLDSAVDTDIGQAFEDLRREVSLTRRAVEGLTAARERVPDYSPTLAKMAEALTSSLAHLDRIERSPAVRLSPDAMAAEIVKASAVARAEDVRLLREASNALSQSIGRVDGMIERGQAVDGQRRIRMKIAIGGIVLGMLIWAVLPGVFARSLPATWHVPEWMAARMMGLDQRQAGERMIRTAQQ